MWLGLLNKAVEASSITQVATELDVSRTTVSLVLSDKYPAKTDKLQERVINVYGKVHCPFLALEISLSECKKHHTSAVPTSSPRAMKHWLACQGCDYKTVKNGENS